MIAFARVAKLRILIFVLVSIVLVNIFLMVHKNKSVHEIVNQFSKIKLKNLDLYKNLTDDDDDDGFRGASQAPATLRSDDENVKISWDDKDFMNYELTRIGPGEHGVAVELTDPTEIKLNVDWLQKEGFYVNVSNKISFTRSLPDLRPES